MALHKGSVICLCLTVIWNYFNS